MGQEFQLNGQAPPTDTTIEVADTATAQAIADAANAATWTDLDEVPADVEWVVITLCESRWPAGSDEDGEYEAGEFWTGSVLRREMQNAVELSSGDSVPLDSDNWDLVGNVRGTHITREQVLEAAGPIKESVLKTEALAQETMRIDLV